MELPSKVIDKEIYSVANIISIQRTGQLEIGIVVEIQSNNTS